MATSFKKKGSTLILSLSGELDAYNAVSVRSEMEAALMGNDYDAVCVDMSGLDFMDSSGIGVLFGRYKKLFKRRIPVYLSGVKPNIDRMLLMSGIYRLMPRIEDEKEMRI
ncbi:MAG: anti-sigma factor antagonist [Eubacteriales bacterium]|nr:anti-sigma factor antagonist [Eubacteriales bacterium]